MGGALPHLAPPPPPAPAGVFLSKDLMRIAGHALKANITTLGPLVLPISEQLLFFANLVARKVGVGAQGAMVAHLAVVQGLPHTLLARQLPLWLRCRPGGCQGSASGVRKHGKAWQNIPSCRTSPSLPPPPPPRSSCA